FDTRTVHDLDQHIQQIGSLFSKTVEAARVTAQLALRRDEAQARQRERSVPPTAFLEYCVCIHYDADPGRRIADPARIILHGGHLAPDLIQLSGGTPLFTQPGDTTKWIAFDDIRVAQ